MALEISGLRILLECKGEQLISSLGIQLKRVNYNSQLLRNRSQLAKSQGMK